MAPKVIPSIHAKATTPSFARKTELARYIPPEDCNGKNHATSTAFQLSDVDLTHNQPHLSVNAIELEGTSVIAAQYRSQFQKGNGKVAVCTHKVQRYLDGAKKQELALTANATLIWSFVSASGVESAFRHRPTQLSKSHSGVEFIRTLPDYRQKSLARYLSRYPRFHLL